MPRKRRIHFEGAVFHAGHRGNDRQEIFFDERDRGAYLALLREGTERFGHSIIAYCLMPNHTHILVKVGRIPLSEIMHNLTFRYAIRINRKRGRVGHLFQGRYFSKIVTGNPYLLALVRYVHQNPVSGGLVAHPADYRWSSHRTYLGTVSQPWVDTKPVLGALDDREHQALHAYRNLVEGCDSDDAPVAVDDADLGSAGPLSDRPIPRALFSVTRAVCVEYALSETALESAGPGNHRLSEARFVAAMLYRDEFGGSFATVGDMLRCSRSGISAGVQRLRSRADRNPALSERLERVRRLARHIYASL